MISCLPASPQMFGAAVDAGLIRRTDLACIGAPLSAARTAITAEIAAISSSG